jgi:hypothetical protein
MNEHSPRETAMRALFAPPRPGVLAADLNDRERTALAIHAGAPYEVEMTGTMLTIRTTVPCGIVDRGDGGYIVAIGQRETGVMVELNKPAGQT